MQKMILDIFDRVNSEIPNLAETERAMSQEIEAVLEAAQEKIPQEYHDELDRSLFEAASLAERKGFELGVKYMAKLFIECLS